MEVEVVSAGSSKSIASVTVTPTTTIAEIKQQLHSLKKAPYAGRQCLRLEPKGKALSDSETVKNLQLKYGSKLYFKDLGPQIGWKTVFLAEYAGPLFVYLWVYQRPWIFYGDVPDAKIDTVVHWAAACWSLHYAKRLLETLFVHRFSHATMPLRNLFKNCSYYWLFTMYVAYHVNHPLYTPPSGTRFVVGAAIFFLCELGNLSIHLALRNLRPPGRSWKLDRFYNYDPVPSSWFVYVGGCLPDGRLGARKAQALQEGVLGLPQEPQSHLSFCSVNKRTFLVIYFSNAKKRLLKEFRYEKKSGVVHFVLFC